MLNKLRWAVINRLLDLVGWLLPHDKPFKVEWEPHVHPIVTMILDEQRKKEPSP